jgi:hypothetical protein
MNKTRKQSGHGRIGVLNPWWGGTKTKHNRKRDTKATRKNKAKIKFKIQKTQQQNHNHNVFESLMDISELIGGDKRSKGGACPCQAVPPLPVALGGYRPTKRNLKYLKKWRKGESIGFTIRSSLKAKGLIPRANGKKRISPKYRN